MIKFWDHLETVARRPRSSSGDKEVLGEKMVLKVVRRR